MSVFAEGTAKMGERVAPLLENGAENTLNAVNNLVQQGPKGVSKLAFLVALITTFTGLFEVVTMLLNPLSIIVQPFHLVLSLYIICFGCTGCVLECDTEWLATMKYWPIVQVYVPDCSEKLQGYQRLVFHRANILTDVYGRAAFYGFLGILCGTQCLLCPFFLVGLINIALAALLIYLMNQETPDMSYENVRREFFNRMEDASKTVQSLSNQTRM